MSFFKKEQKSYNKDVLETGRQAIQYQRNALGLINKYTTDYSGRLDYWTNKLNNRQLNLLSDKYLASNASMMRGQSAFGSNSATKLKQDENAYSQQNYLANVQNANVAAANQLQTNELTALGNAAKTYENPILMGGNAAKNVDAINSTWFSALGKGMSSVGEAGIQSGNPWGMIIGAAVKQTGDTMTGLTSEETELGKGLNTATASNMQSALQGAKDLGWIKSSDGDSTLSTSNTTNGAVNLPSGGLFDNLQSKGKINNSAGLFNIKK